MEYLHQLIFSTLYTEIRKRIVFIPSHPTGLNSLSYSRVQNLRKRGKSS
ncbi:hypothetical protein BCAH1134_C0332 (plasmid) [Bacillus cereus AH1134]|nr:hypothetical protein BCAH1134_C0332 [Bacillus cereus AH1134]